MAERGFTFVSLAHRLSAMYHQRARDDLNPRLAWHDIISNVPVELFTKLHPDQ